MERCKFCKKKSYINITCKCGNSYCIKHRLPEIHECSKMEEFKKLAYEKNNKNLIYVKTDKLIDQI